MIYFKNNKKKNQTHKEIAVIKTMWLYHVIIHPQDVDRIANSVDPDQSAPSGF